MSSLNQSLGSLYDHANVNNYYNSHLRIIQLGNTQNGALSSVINNYYQGHINSDNLIPATVDDFQDQITELYNSLEPSPGFDMSEGNGFQFEIPGTSDNLSLSFPDFGSSQVSLYISNSSGDDIEVPVSYMSIITLNQMALSNIPFTISILNIGSDFSNIYSSMDNAEITGLEEVILKIEDNSISGEDDIVPPTTTFQSKNNWQNILDKIKSIIRKEFKSIPVVLSSKEVKNKNISIRIFPLSQKLVSHSHSSRLYEYTFEIVLYYSITNPSESDYKYYLNYSERLESIIFKNRNTDNWFDGIVPDIIINSEDSDSPDILTTKISFDCKHSIG
jgi:hypothetical protein